MIRLKFKAVTANQKGKHESLKRLSDYKAFQQKLCI